MTISFREAGGLEDKVPWNTSHNSRDEKNGNPQGDANLVPKVFILPKPDETRKSIENEVGQPLNSQNAMQLENKILEEKKDAQQGREEQYRRRDTIEK
jgi:hypothetical protein